MALLAIARNHDLDPGRCAPAGEKAREAFLCGAGARPHIQEERQPGHLIGQAPEHEDREDEIVDDPLSGGAGQKARENATVVEIVLHEEQHECCRRDDEHDEIDQDFGACPCTHPGKKIGHL